MSQQLVDFATNVTTAIIKETAPHLWATHRSPTGSPSILISAHAADTELKDRIFKAAGKLDINYVEIIHQQDTTPETWGEDLLGMLNRNKGIRGIVFLIPSDAPKLSSKLHEISRKLQSLIFVTCGTSKPVDEELHAYQFAKFDTNRVYGQEVQDAAELGKALTIASMNRVHLRQWVASIGMILALTLSLAIAASCGFGGYYLAQRLAEKAISDTGSFDSIMIRPAGADSEILKSKEGTMGSDCPECKIKLATGESITLLDVAFIDGLIEFPHEPGAICVDRQRVPEKTDAQFVSQTRKYFTGGNHATAQQEKWDYFWDELSKRALDIQYPPRKSSQPVVRFASILVEGENLEGLEIQSSIPGPHDATSRLKPLPSPSADAKSAILVVTDGDKVKRNKDDLFTVETVVRASKRRMCGIPHMRPDSLPSKTK